MLFELFRAEDPRIALIAFLLTVPTVIIALTVHETAHGYIAYRLGDPTAKNLGRLSLNPVKHLDLFGTLAMLIVGYGWAKPVPINTRYFKKPRRDMALTALAGPVSNLLLGFLGEGAGIPAGGLHEEVESAIGLGGLVAHGGEAFVQ